MSTSKILLAEALGTFLLASAIEFNTVYFEGTQTSNTFSILAGFFIAITVTREISGGHINPAVTFSFYLAEEKPDNKSHLFTMLFPYMISQCLGAICAPLLGMLLYNGNIFKLAPSPSASLVDAFLLEMIGSAFFFSVILVQSNKDAYGSTDKTLSTLMITGGLACGSAFAGNISGAGLNPAIGFGFNVARLLITGQVDECKYLWIYIVSPLCGSFIASWFYSCCFKKFYEDDEQSLKKDQDYSLMDSKKKVEMNNL